MNAYFHRDFKKAFRKLKPGIQKQFEARKNLFLNNEFHPLLHNHPLINEYAGFRSINVNGDVRAIYCKLNSDSALFIAIGTHSQLYG